MDVTSNISEQADASRGAMRRVPIADLILPDGRSHTESNVAAMADSIGLIGLQTPPSIDSDNNIIAGILRVLGACRAGLTEIDCFVIADDKVGFRWAIAENLHRVELNTLERSSALVQWADAKGAQVGQVSVGGRGQQGGVAQAARMLGVSRSALRRAVAIDGIPADSRAAIRKAGLEDNQSALMSIAATPVEQQLEKIGEYSTNDHPAPTSRAGMRFQALMRAWENADHAARARFITEVVEPYAAASQPVTTQ